MLTLYYTPTCPFSQRVMQVAENLKVEFDLKDISEDEAARAELIKRAGETETPYLVDTEKDVAVDESSDIIDYIREHYANSDGAVASAPRVHISNSVCESCEG